MTIARTPQDVHRLVSAAFAAGDLDALVSLYEPTATLVPQPGTVVSGHAAIRVALAGFLALKPRLDMQAPRILQAGDTALLYANWILHGTGPDGKAVTMQGQTSDVVHRQPDGRWLLVIDNPFGTEGGGE